MPAERTLRTISYQDQPIEFHLIQTKRRSLGILVRRDQRVEVRAPRLAKTETVDRWVYEKAPWILKHRERFAKLHYVPEKKYEPGEKHFYFGEALTLQVVESTMTDVDVQGDWLIVKTKDTQPRNVKKLVNRWFEAQAKAYLPERLQEIKGNFHPRSIPVFTTYIRRMKSRWGSCSSTGKITLNTTLIHYPSDCIDYVMVHEISHLFVPNHSKAFHDLMEQALPGAKMLRKRLKSLHYG